MEVGAAVASLPEPYRKALQAVARGADEGGIAAALDIPEASAHTFVRLAVAKLDSLLKAEPSGGPNATGT